MIAGLRFVLVSALAASVAGCLQGGPPCRELYASCATDAQCPTESRCGLESWEYGSGQICQQPCEDLRDCPRADGRDGLCLDVQRDGSFFCYRSCTSSSQCPIGWVCQPYRSSESEGGVCLP